MTAEQSAELLELLRDLYSVSGGILAGLGLLLGIALWFIMFHATGRSGFWGGVVLLGVLFSGADASAEWTYTTWKNTILDAPLTPEQTNPQNAQWTEFVRLGGSPQAHWLAWYNNGSPSNPPNTGSTTYQTKFLADLAVMQSYETFALAVTGAGFTAPTYAQWSAFPGTAAQRMTHWTTWRKYYPQLDVGSTAYVTTFVNDGNASRLLPVAPGGTAYQAFIETTYAAGVITPTLSEYNSLVSYGGNPQSHWAAWWNNGNPTGNTVPNSYRLVFQSAVTAQQQKYSQWTNWKTPIEAAGYFVPSLAEWDASPGTTLQRQQYWVTWLSYHENDALNEALFLLDWNADVVAGNVVPTPPSGADFQTFVQLVQQWGANPPTEAIYRDFVAAGGDASLHVHDYALVNYGNATALQNYPTAMQAAASSGDTVVPIQGSANYVSHARAVLAVDQSPPVETDYNTYVTAGYDPAAFLPLWVDQGTVNGPQSYQAAFAANAAVVSSGNVSGNPACCGLPSQQPCLGHYWAKASIIGRRNTVWTVSVDCGSCVEITGSGEIRCSYAVNGNDQTALQCLGQISQVTGPWHTYQFTSRPCGSSTPCAASCSEFKYMMNLNGDRAPNCLEFAILNAACSGPLNCSGRTLNCALYALVGDSCSYANGTGCNNTNPPDPDCDHATDGDCDGCPDSEEPCGQPCPGDFDCDGCPNDSDTAPMGYGGECDQPPEECEGDADCDECPDDAEPAEGEFSENPACQCDTTEGDGEPDDRDCNGCPDEWDGETRTWKNRTDCGPEDTCKDKGGDTDRDGCCDDDDTSPEDASDEEQKCEDCTQDVLAKIEELTQRIQQQWMPAFQVGSADPINASITLDNIDGNRVQWRINFMTGLIEGTFVDPGAMAGASDALMTALAQARDLEAFIIVVLGILSCWYIVNGLGGGAV